jgi:hypothetical protein
MERHHADYEPLVLPEVLRNPVAFLRMNTESKKKERLLKSLSKLKLKPGFRPLRLKKKPTKQKKPVRTFQKKDASNRIIKRTALSTKYNFDILGIFYRVILNF